MASRVSRGFRDISLSFTKHPVTNDILALNNEDAIKRSVINLVRTQIGEKFFEPLIGTSLEGSLFELSHPEIEIQIESEINVLLENFEPRISVSRIKAQPLPDDYELAVNIVYDIVGLAIPRQNIEFILQPARI
jgi:phage baseplate assembly protein W|tara:strand:+ start:3737 stop:4138 length:402 start_codon:yes stop_codon:yes gene_type:complete